MPRATKLKKTAAGQHVSAKSKTGDPQCSAAMSAWKTGGMTSQVASVLGKCRAKARALKGASLHREAGNEARAQHLEHRAKGTGPISAKDRATRAKELIAQRQAKQQAKVESRPTLRAQAEAHRVSKGTPQQRAIKLHDRAKQLSDQQHFRHLPVSNKQLSNVHGITHDTSNPKVQKAIARTDALRQRQQYLMGVRFGKTTVGNVPKDQPKAAEQAKPASPTEPRRITLKATSPEHKAATRAVETAMRARHYAEQANGSQASFEGRKLMFGQAQRSYDRAQERLKASKQAAKNGSPATFGQRPAAEAKPAQRPAPQSPPARPTPPVATSKPAGHAPVSDQEFAGRVKAAAARVASQRGEWGTFGDVKVFIHHAHAEYQKAHGPISIGEFKNRLAKGNQARHLDLSRADLVEAMDPADVAASHTTHLGATYNFVRAPRDLMSAPTAARRERTPATARSARLERMGHTTPEAQGRALFERQKAVKGARERLEATRQARAAAKAPARPSTPVDKGSRADRLANLAMRAGVMRNRVQAAGGIESNKRLDTLFPRFERLKAAAASASAGSAQPKPITPTAQPVPAATTPAVAQPAQPRSALNGDARAFRARELMGRAQKAMNKARTNAKAATKRGDVARAEQYTARAQHHANRLEQLAAPATGAKWATGTVVSTTPAQKAAAAPKSSASTVHAEVKSLHDRAHLPETSIEQINALGGKLNALPKGELVKAAEGIGLVGMHGRPKAVIQRNIVDRIRAVKQSAVRTAISDRPRTTVAAPTVSRAQGRGTPDRQQRAREILANRKAKGGRVGDAAIRVATGKIFRGGEIDDRGLTVQQLSKSAGVKESAVAKALNRLSAKKVIEFDDFEDHDAAMQRSAGVKLHTNRKTGKAIHLARIFRPQSL